MHSFESGISLLHIHLLPSIRPYTLYPKLLRIIRYWVSKLNIISSVLSSYTSSQDADVIKNIKRHLKFINIIILYLYEVFSNVC